MNRPRLHCLFLACCISLSHTGQVSLDAKDWQVRAAALTRIGTDVPKDPALKKKLIDLLKSENEIVKSSLERSKGKEGVSATLGEGYSEYYSELFDAVLSIAKGDDISALSVIADGAFNNDSRAASLFVERWNLTLPVFLKKLRRGPIERAQSLLVIGRIANLKASTIPSDQMREIKEAVRVGFLDQSPGVRIAAIHSASEAGFAEFLPTLDNLAHQDPVHLLQAGKIRYPVREEAVKAVQSLNQQ